MSTSVANQLLKRVRILLGGLFVALLSILALNQVFNLENFGKMLADWGGFWSYGTPIFLAIEEQMVGIWGIAFIVGFLLTLVIYDEEEVKEASESEDQRAPKAGGGIVGFLVAFVIIRVTMAFVYEGSSLSEYWYIFSGQALFTDEALPSLVKETVSGSIMTLFVGMALMVFGFQVWVTNLIPVLISIGSLFLLLIIGFHAFRSQKSIILLLLFYTFTPWIIVTHLEVGMYVVYEFLALLVIVLMCRVVATLKQRRFRGASVWGVLAIGIPIGVHFAIESAVSFAILLMALVLALYLFLYQIQYIFIRAKQKDPHRTLTEIDVYPRLLFLYKILVLLVLGTVIFAVFGLKERIVQFFETSRIPFTSSDGTLYGAFLFENHPLESIFIALVPLVLLLSVRERVFAVITMLGGGVLAFVHMHAPAEYQQVTDLLYLFPLLFIGVLLVMEHFQQYTEASLVIPLLLILTMVGNYPERFFTGPYIPNETSYTQYKEAYAYVKDKCTDLTLVENIPVSPVAQFYEVTPDYGLSIIDSGKTRKLDTFAQEYASAKDFEVLNTQTKVNAVTQEGYCYLEHESERFKYTTFNGIRAFVLNADSRTQFRNATVYKKDNL